MGPPHAASDLFQLRHGAGPMMLVMHGGLGWDHTYLRPWLDPLGEAFELVYYDHAGNGRSPEPPNWDEVTHETWVDGADALREALGEERIFVLGHSYGAFLAMEYALAHPKRVRGLVLVSAAPALDYPDVAMANARALAEARGTPEQAEAVAAGLSAPIADDETLARTVETILPLYFRDPANVPAVDGIRFRAAAHNRAFFECVPRFDLTVRLSELEVPTLLLAGRHDWLMPPEHGAERIDRRLADSELVIFEESGHFPFIEERDAFLARTRSWLEARVS